MKIVNKVLFEIITVITRRDDQSRLLDEANVSDNRTRVAVN